MDDDEEEEDDVVDMRMGPLEEDNEEGEGAYYY